MTTTESLQPELCTVADLFNDEGAIYTVPVYQRSYAWEAVQIEQLISDVKDAMDEATQKGQENREENGEGNNYFLGNLVVTRRGSTSDPTLPADYEVIDGQQRLTTLYLLLTYLSREDSSPSFQGHKGRLRYESRPRSSEALRRFDAGYPETSTKLSPDSDDDAGIEQGFNVIRQYFQDASNGLTGKARVDFAEFLLQSVQVVRAALPPSTDLNQYFEIMNTRGVQLQPVDIVKARLMSTLETEAERSCFARIWDACSEMDAYLQVALTRGDPDRRNELFGDDWSWLETTDFPSLSEQLSPESDIERQNSHAVGESLDDALNRYAAIDDVKAPPESESERFSSTITFPSLLLHALKLFPTDGNHVAGDEEDERSLDDKRLIKHFEDAFGKNNSELVRSFAVHLLKVRALFDAFILKREFTGTYVEEGQWSLKVLRKVGTGETPSVGFRNTFQPETGEDTDREPDASTRSLLLLESMLRITFTAPRSMHWITLVLGRCLRFESSDKVTAKALIKVLRDYVRTRIRDTFPIGDEDAFSETIPQGFNIPRLVFTYLDYLLLEPDQVPASANHYLFAFRTSVEHFYPQNPDKQQQGTEVSKDNLNLLGNLALVSVGANSKFNNSLPLAKATNYAGTIALQSPKLLLMAERTRKNEGWSDDDVRDHHAKMIELLRGDIARE